MQTRREFFRVFAATVAAATAAVALPLDAQQWTQPELRKLPVHDFAAIDWLDQSATLADWEDCARQRMWALWRLQRQRNLRFVGEPQIKRAWYADMNAWLVTTTYQGVIVPIEWGEVPLIKV